MELLYEAGDVIGAFLTNDAWEIRQALNTGGAWLTGFVVTLAGAVLVLAVYKAVPLIDRHLERTVMVWTYLIIAGVIFVEVFRRFVLSEQAPWSTTLPPMLFLIMTWFGCAFNVRLRTHLAFSEFRTSLPPGGQISLLVLDAILWFVFCWIVVVTSSRVAAGSAANFQLLLGTDNVHQWWFLVTVPIAFILLAARALENVLEDIGNYRAGQPIIKQAIIGAD